MKFNTIKVSVMALALAGVGFFSGLSVTANAQTQDKPTQGKPTQEKPSTKAPSTKPAEAVTITGLLTAGDASGLTVTDAQKADHKVAVTTDTKVTKAGKDATLADLKMNDKVTIVAAKNSDGSLIASSIDVNAE
jgi:Domain of unknown function (DUF5666)